VAVVVLLVQAGWYVLWTLAVAVAAILYDHKRTRRTVIKPRPAVLVTCGAPAKRTS
jgi:hypothetical protein